MNWWGLRIHSIYPGLILSEGTLLKFPPGQSKWTVSNIKYGWWDDRSPITHYIVITLMRSGLSVHLTLRGSTATYRIVSSCQAKLHLDSLSRQIMGMLPQSPYIHPLHYSYPPTSILIPSSMVSMPPEALSFLNAQVRIAKFVMGYPRQPDPHYHEIFWLSTTSCSQ